MKAKERLAVLSALVGIGLALIAMTLGSQEIEGKVAAAGAITSLLCSLFYTAYQFYETLNSPLKVQVLLRGVGDFKQNFKAFVYLDRRTGQLSAPTQKDELRLQEIVSLRQELETCKLLGAPYWKVVEGKVWMLGETYYA